jgi:3-oxoacyl-[acyl-carrier protein] reductase
MKKLENKVAIVTGSTRGIGKAVALAMATEGAKVIINDKSNSVEASDLVKEVQNDGGIASFIRADVSQMAEVEEMVNQVLEEYGKIDILVNNAGISRDAFLVEMSQEDWWEVINVNLGGVFNCTKAVIRPMMLQRSGKIINISSIAAEFGLRGQCNYNSSKAAVNGFTISAAIDLATFGIQVNAVAPGIITTMMTEKLRKSVGNRILPLIFLERFGEPEEVAKVILFLASEDSNYLTGEIIHVTGGLGAGIGARY